MRIGFVTEFSSLGGGETNLVYLVSELITNWGIRALVICPPGQLSDLCQQNNIQFVNANLVKWKGWLWGIPLPWYNRRVVRALGECDIVHSYSLHALPLLFWLKVPLVWTNHGIWEKVKGMRAKVINKMIAVTVTVSNEVHRLAMLPENKKALIHLGVPLRSVLQPLARRKLDKHVEIACIGRFAYIKGQDLLVDAVSSLAVEFNDMYFHVRFVGGVNSSLREDHRFLDLVKNKTMVNRRPNLEFIFEGFQKDVTPFMCTADLVVVPSRYESFSMVTVEALANGKPVVVPCIGGPIDIISSKTTGLFFRPGDACSLRMALSAAIKNYQQFNPEDCIKNAERFSIANQAKKMVDLYLRILGWEQFRQEAYDVNTDKRSTEKRDKHNRL